MLSKLGTWNEFDKSGTLKHCIHKDKIHLVGLKVVVFDENQNIKDLLKMLIGPITRARAKKL